MFSFLRPSFIVRAAKTTERVGSSIATRQFSHLPSVRPSISPLLTRTANLPSFIPSASSSPPGTVLDLLPKPTTHPALSSISTQIRCGPRNTYDPSHFVRKRRHGFLSRVKTRKGRATLQRRRAKRRSTLSH